MMRMDKKEKAQELFKSNCNCCQSVFASFCDETGMDFETALKLTSSFGGGIGGLREVCGAVSAMCMVSGLLCGYTNQVDDEGKKAHAARVKELAGRFKERYGSIICRQLLDLEGKPEGTPAPHGDASPCPGFVGGAAEILDDWLKEQESK
jgi:C_GCAxxG_C_C family probable redox protein